MTKKLFSKIGLIFILSVLCVFCACAFLVACSSDKNNSDSETTKTYSYTETDTDLISNQKFAYGTIGKTASDFPLTSPTGWTKATDDSAATSNVDSGVINIADWESVFDKLYSDSDFIKFCDSEFKNDADYKDKTDEEKKTFVKTKFANPDKYSDGADNYVYMLNNYSSTYSAGTAQRIRSSSSVSVKKGEIYTVSVYVKTNIFYNFGEKTGANIRFVNSVNGNSQAEFQINNIVNTDWQKYTVYFVANADYDCSFTLMLGLGYGNGASDRVTDYVKGTVFFDDISIEKFDGDITAVTFDNTETLSYGAKDAKTVSPAGNNVYKYDMNFDTAGYFTDVNLTEKSFYLTNESKTFTVKDGGVDDGNDFEITTDDTEDYEQYSLISFKLFNNLNKLGSTDITVNVVDKYHDDTDGKDYSETRKAVTTFSDVSDEFINCNIIVRNNFKNQTRKFYLEIVIGPTDTSAVKALSEFASGTVKIKDIKVATGYISSEKYPNKADDTTYKLYSFYNSNANSTTALYAGFEADYSEHDHSPSYSLNPASGTIGTIVNKPSAVNGYFGVSADHVYVNENSDNVISNDRLSFTGENGYAGLINTKYNANYPAELNAALTGLYSDDDIQPIVIYNKNVDHYGFIGSQQTVSASDYAKVTVRLAVNGGAKAYIYLVNTLNKKKEVLTFADFTVNTDAGIENAGLNTKSYNADDHKFMLVVDGTTEKGADNWVEVSFYLATGADSKSFRVEVWNGGRDGAAETASQGYVFIDAIDVNTSSAFTEPETWQSAFDSSTSPLYNKIDEFDEEKHELIAYTRNFTETEKAFNKEYPDKAVSYKPTYIWANNETLVYGVFNTVNPVETNPYDGIEKEETESGCAANSDPSTFWLSFSSIALAIVLVLAIIALFIKRLRIRHIANKSDAKSQYKVKSRTESQKAINKAKEQKAKKEASENTETVEPKTETPESVEEITESTENDGGDDTEQTGYVYGDVQDFGDMTLDIDGENKPEENSEKDSKDE